MTWSPGRSLRRELQSAKGSAQAAPQAAAGQAGCHRSTREPMSSLDGPPVPRPAPAQLDCLERAQISHEWIPNLSPQWSQPRPASFWNVPNTLTVSRLVLAVFVFALIANEFYFWALVLFAIAAVTDALDGYFARLLKQDTPLGRQLDPLVDKVIVSGCYIYLATIPETGVMPWMVTAIVVRELLIQGLRSHLEGRGQAFGARMAGKLKTVVPVFLDLPDLVLSRPLAFAAAGLVVAARRADLARRYPHDLQRLELCLDCAAEFPRRELTFFVSLAPTDFPD